MSLKTKPEIDLQIKDDLRHIPRGGSTQNRLRQYYPAMRRHDIANIAKTKEDTLKEIITQLRKEEPTFTPEYDKDYFKKL